MAFFYYLDKLSFWFGCAWCGSVFFTSNLPVCYFVSLKFKKKKRKKINRQTKKIQKKRMFLLLCRRNVCFVLQQQVKFLLMEHTHKRMALRSLAFSNQYVSMVIFNGFNDYWDNKRFREKKVFFFKVKEKFKIFFFFRFEISCSCCCWKNWECDWKNNFYSGQSFFFQQPMKWWPIVSKKKKNSIAIIVT